MQSNLGEGTYAQGTKQAGAQPIGFYAIDVSFQGLSDPAERDAFMSLPTTFHLTKDTIDRLTTVAHRLLYHSPEFSLWAPPIWPGFVSGPGMSPHWRLWGWTTTSPTRWKPAVSSSNLVNGGF